MPAAKPIVYKQSGVNIDEADRAVASIRTMARGTFSPAVLTDIGSFGVMDSNYYARPLDDSLTIQCITHQFNVGATQVRKNYTLTAWKSAYAKDKYSKKSPKTFPVTINPDDSIKFVYNATNAAKTFSLPGTYIDIKNVKYTNSITLQPYASAVLLVYKTGTASPVVTITSPKVNATYKGPASVLLTATATDADGTIKKVEFYNGSTLVHTENMAPYSWTWEKVPAGTYKLTAKATDNSGHVTTSTTVTFTVTASTLTEIKTATLEQAVVAEKPLASADIRLFPNPASSVIYLQPGDFFKGADHATISIVNAAGSVVKTASVSTSDNNIHIDISALNRGFYLLTMSNGKAIISRKFIKE